MSKFEKSKSFKDRVKRIFGRSFKVKSSTKELICAWIQVTESLALAAYLYKKGTDGTLVFMFSAIGVSGLCNCIQILRRNYYIEVRRNWSLWDLAIGTLTYSTSVYAFSEFLRCNDRLWIPCLTLAAIGYYFAISTINTLDTVLHKRPLLKCFQLTSEPVLAACGAFYLVEFRNHTEAWLKCLPFLVTAVAGLKIADRGVLRYARMDHTIVLKAVEMCTGGCILCISCTALAIYSSSNGIYWFVTAFMSFWSLYGACVAMDSFEWLYGIVPEPEYRRYRDRVMGPVLIVGGSLFAAYIGYHMGWRFSVYGMPIMASAIRLTYNAFKRRNEFQ